MRSALLIRLPFLLLFLCVAAFCQPPGQQINPHTQIRWPRNCTGPGHVYNLENNTCIDMDAINPATQLTWPGGCSTASMVYAPQSNSCYDINAISPSNQLVWPANCSAAGMVYNFTTNSCINMNAIDPTSQVVWPNNCSNPNTVYVPATKTCSTSVQGPPGPPGGSLSYPGVTSDGNNGMNITGSTATTAAMTSGPPMLDIRNPSFAGGAICDGTKNHPIDAALQAALNASSMGAGGQVYIVGSPNYCYLANPPAIAWRSGTTVNIQGILNTGTTFTIPPGVMVNIVGQNGAQPYSASFSAPSNMARIAISPATGGGTGTLGATITPTYTGTGDPTATAPATCNSSITGAIYQDTTPVDSIYWTCAITTGSISATSNSLSVSNAAGFTTGTTITVAGAGASGGTLSTSITAIAGTILTLAANAGTTVSGAAVTATGNTTTATISTNMKFGWIPGAVVTFTPSSMSGLVNGGAITVGQACSATINTISRASNNVTANVTFPTGCKIPPGVVGNVAGVTDSTFNGTHVNGGASGTYMVQSSDYNTGTMTWKQNAAADASSTGGTVTGMNEYNIEDIYVTGCTSTTCTATFFRPHNATDTWGVVGVALQSNGQPGTLSDFSINAPGVALWMPQTYLTRITRVNVSSTTGCGQNPATSIFGFAVDTGLSTWMFFDSDAFVSFCEPFSVHQSTPFNAGYANNGPSYISNSFMLSGIKQDFGGMGVFMSNSVCDQCARGVVSIDNSTPYWDGNPNFLHFDNVWTQDNPNGFQTCYVNQMYPFGYSTSYVDTSRIAGFTGCVVNDYFSGSLRSDSGSYSTNTHLGVTGILNNGRVMDAEVRGEQADLSPALVPFATANIDPTGASWSVGACTKATVQGPDGTSDAVSLSGASNVFATMGSQTITPQVGDMVLWGGWVYTTTLGARSGLSGSGTGGAITVDNNSSANYKLGGQTSTFTAVNVYDPLITNDWWHPVIGFTTVTQSNGTAGQVINLRGGCNTASNLIYFKPWLMYIPASSGVTKDEVMRWRQQLLHGAVPPNATAGQLYANNTLNAPLQDKGGQVYNVKSFGAKGDDTADDAPVLRSVAATVNAAGSGTIYFPAPGTYRMKTADPAHTNEIMMGQSNHEHIVCAPGAVIDMQDWSTSNAPALFMLAYNTGAMGAFPWSGTIYPFTVIPNAGASSITMTNPGDTANFAVGDGVYIYGGPGSESGTDGEWNWITGINSGTGVMTLQMPTSKPYTGNLTTGPTGGPYIVPGVDHSQSPAVNRFWQDISVEGCTVINMWSNFLYAAGPVIGLKMLNNRVFNNPASTHAMFFNPAYEIVDMEMAGNYVVTAASQSVAQFAWGNRDIYVHNNTFISPFGPTLLNPSQGVVGLNISHNNFYANAPSSFNTVNQGVIVFGTAYGAKVDSNTFNVNYASTAGYWVITSGLSNGACRDLCSITNNVIRFTSSSTALTTAITNYGSPMNITGNRIFLIGGRNQGIGVENSSLNYGYTPGVIANNDIEMNNTSSLAVGINYQDYPSSTGIREAQVIISGNNIHGDGATISTTGSITTGTNSLSVASATGIVVGNVIVVTGAGLSGGLLDTTVTAIAGTTLTLAANASTTVTSANVSVMSILPGTGIGFSANGGGLISGNNIFNMGTPISITGTGVAPTLANNVCTSVTTPAGCSLPSAAFSAAGTALPTCNVNWKGQTATVSDATAPAYMAAYTSGGAVTAQVICSYNGTTYSWLTH